MAPVLPWGESSSQSEPKAVTPPVEGPAGDDDEAPRGPGAHAVAAAPGQVGLECVAGEPARGGSELPVSPAARAQFKGGAGVVAHAGGLTTGWIKEGRGKYRFALFDGSELRATELTGRAGSDYATLTPDGSYVITAAGGDAELWQVTVADGAVRLLHKFDDTEMYSVAVLANGDVVVGDSDSIRWMAPAGEGLEQVQRLGVNPYGIAPDAGHRAVVVEANAGSSNAAWVLARDGAVVRTLAKFRFDYIDSVYGTADGARVEVGEEVYRTTGVADALAHVSDFEPAPEFGAASSEDARDDGEAVKPGGYVVEAAAGQVGLAFVGTEAPPGGEDVPEDVAKLFKNGAELYRLPGGFTYGWLKEARNKFRFALHEGGAFRPTELVHRSATGMVSVRHDRKQLALALGDSDDELYVMDVAEGKARAVYKFEDDSIGNLALLADGSVAALAGGGLFVLVPDEQGGGGLRVLAKLAVDGGRVEAEADGRVMVVEHYSEPTLTVLARDGDVVRVLATFTP